MKGTPIILGMFLLLALTAYADETPSGVSLHFNLINQEPDPVEPGSYVTVRFKIDNRGSDNAQQMVFELVPSYPFSLEPGSNAQRDVGTVWGRQKDELGVIVKYRLGVDKDAVNGDSPVRVKYKLKDDVWINVDRDFNISVKSSRAIVEIRSVDAPEMVVPGSVFWLNISMVNLAHTAVKDIRVKLDIPATTTFVPVGSANEKVIDKLGFDEEAVVSFKFSAAPEADAGVYRIPVVIDYLDELNSKYSENNTIGLVVGSSPELLVGVENSDIYIGKPGSVTIRFVNKGINDIKLLYAVLGESDDYEIISSNDAYVGNIDSDDYETVEFKLFVKDKSELILPLSVEYLDANNRQYSEEHNLKLRVYSSSEAVKYGLKKKSNLTGIIIVVVIIVIGVFAYKRFRRRSK